KCVVAGVEVNVCMPEHETIMPNPDTGRRSCRIMILLLLALVVAISGCSREKLDEDASAEQLYNWANAALRAKTWPEAVSRYKFLTTRHPFGRHAEQAQLRSEEHTSELQSRFDLVCSLLLERKKTE